MFNGILVIFRNRALLSICGEQPQPWKYPEIFQGFCGVPLANSSTKIEPVPGTGVFRWWHDVWLGHCLPHYLNVPFKFLSHIFKEVSTVAGFPMAPRVSFMVSCPSPHSLPYSSLASSSPLNPPTPVSPMCLRFS